MLSLVLVNAAMRFEAKKSAAALSNRMPVARALSSSIPSTSLARASRAVLSDVVSRLPSTRPPPRPPPSGPRAGPPAAALRVMQPQPATVSYSQVQTAAIVQLTIAVGFDREGGSNGFVSQPIESLEHGQARRQV